MKIYKKDLIDVSKIKNLNYFIKKCDVECIRKSYALYLHNDDIVNKVIEQFNNIGKSLIRTKGNCRPSVINKYFIVENNLYFITFEYTLHVDEDNDVETVFYIGNNGVDFEVITDNIVNFDIVTNDISKATRNLDEIMFYVGMNNVFFLVMDNEIKVEAIADDVKLKDLIKYLKENNISYKIIQRK